MKLQITFDIITPIKSLQDIEDIRFEMGGRLKDMAHSVLSTLKVIKDEHD